MKNGAIQHSVLIVSGTHKGVASITEMLSPGEFYPVFSAFSGGEARRLLLTNSYDFVIVNTPLPDEFGHELAIHVVGKAMSGAMMIVKSEIYDQVCAQAEPYGILTIPRPVARPLFYQALRLLIATQNRWRRFDHENKKLQTKMEEIRIVARAKCILVEYLRMSEQQAHRYIEKQAMDMRTSKKNIAESILQTYD